MNPPRIERQTPGTGQPGEPRLPVIAPDPAAQQSLFAAPAVALSDARDQPAGRLVMQSTNAPKPHPSLLKQNLRPTEERLLALEKLGEAIFEQPLLITKENLIVDGYARWLIARRQQRSTMWCHPHQGQQTLRPRRSDPAPPKPLSTASAGQQNPKSLEVPR